MSRKEEFWIFRKNAGTLNNGVTSYSPILHFFPKSRTKVQKYLCAFLRAHYPHLPESQVVLLLREGGFVCLYNHIIVLNIL